MKEFLNKIKQCTNCKLCYNQRPLLDISSNASIFWVGLSAVKVLDVNEEKPLSLKTNSGKLISLIEKNCNTEKFYKTNMVKCLPLKDGKIRYPNKQEMRSCFKNFYLETKMFNPKIVFLLGKQVSNFICEEFNLDEVKLDEEFTYKILKINNITYIPVHHPSFILVYKRKKVEKYINKITELIESHSKFRINSPLKNS